MAQFEWVHAAWLALAIVLEIVANVFLKFSDGFRRKIFGLLSLAAVLAAAIPGSALRATGFLAAKSLRSRTPVLHLNTIEFLEGN